MLCVYVLRVCMPHLLAKGFSTDHGKEARHPCTHHHKVVLLFGCRVLASRVRSHKAVRVCGCVCVWVWDVCVLGRWGGDGFLRVRCGPTKLCEWRGAVLAYISACVRMHACVRACVCGGGGVLCMCAFVFVCGCVCVCVQTCV